MLCLPGRGQDQCPTGVAVDSGEDTLAPRRYE